MHADEIHAIPCNRACDVLRRSVAMLQHRAAPSGSPLPAEPVSPEHDPTLEPLAFYLVAESRLVSYAAVLHKQIAHEGETLWIAGLSCVEPDPVYQRRGLGSRVIAAATRYVEHSTIDIGIFTRDPVLQPLHERAGAWNDTPGVVLVGGFYEGALSSDSAEGSAHAAVLCESARCSGPPESHDDQSRSSTGADLVTAVPRIAAAGNRRLAVWSRITRLRRPMRRRPEFKCEVQHLLL